MATYTVTEAARLWLATLRAWESWRRPQGNVLSADPRYRAAMQVHDAQWRAYLTAKATLVAAIERGGD